jgi:hypothetical protein
MAKVSQLQAAIHSIDAEIALLQRARKVLTDTQAEKPSRERKSTAPKRRRNGEGATTDSGNMNYPPA